MKTSNKSRQVAPLVESRFRAIFMATPEAISVTRLADGCYLEVNDAWLALSHRQRDQVIGKSSLELGIWHNSHDRLLLTQRLQRDGHVDSMESDLRRADGQVVRGLLSARNIEIEGQPCILAITRDISERSLREELVRQMAYCDPLTLLPNRRAFQERLTLAIAGTRRTHYHAAVIFLDLNRFKQLNDQWGHDRGDQLLIEVARRLKAGLREVDTVARLGGDEFVALVADLSPQLQPALDTAHAVAIKLVSTLSQPYALSGTSVEVSAQSVLHYQCSASVGVAVFQGTGESPDALMSRADRAMYEAKRSGPGSVRVSVPVSGIR